MMQIAVDTFYTSERITTIYSTLFNKPKRRKAGLSGLPSFVQGQELSRLWTKNSTNMK